MSQGWIGRIAELYEMNDDRLKRYEPGLKRQTPAFDAAQTALKGEVDTLFAQAGRELAALSDKGRAGRDRASARCVLLYAQDDVERQFGMSARSRLTREEIHGILRALRNLDRKKRFGGDVVATAGEILGEDEDKTFERDSATDDNRVRTAVAWLEESELLTREENVVQVFPSSLRVGSVEEARNRLAKPRSHGASPRLPGTRLPLRSARSPGRGPGLPRAAGSRPPHPPRDRRAVAGR